MVLRSNVGVCRSCIDKMLSLSPQAPRRGRAGVRGKGIFVSGESMYQQVPVVFHVPQGPRSGRSPGTGVGSWMRLSGRGWALSVG